MNRNQLLDTSYQINKNILADSFENSNSICTEESLYFGKFINTEFKLLMLQNE